MQRTLKVNAKLLPFLTAHQPIKVAIGGRGSGKSIGVCDMAIAKMERERIDIYCLREFQESLADSLHRTLSRSIVDRLNLHGWDIQETKIISPHGNRTIYKGAARNPTNIQGAEDYRLSIFSEAHTASQESIDRLLPTILRKPGAQCWFEANPQGSADPFSQRFIVPYYDQLMRDGFYQDDMHYIVVVNWRDNPWWNDEQERLRAWDYEHLPRSKYDWIWEGKFNDAVPNSIIDAEWFDACIDAHKTLGFEPLGQEKVAYDPADSGDAKAVAYQHGSVVLGCASIDHGDINTATDWALSKTAEIRPDVFLWDADGVGLGLKRQIAEGLAGKKIQIVPFHGAGQKYNQDDVYEEIDGESWGDKQKTNAEMFTNLRAQCYWALRDRVFKTYLAVKKGKYYSPDELISFSSGIKELQKLRSEVCSIPRVYVASNRIQIMDKPTMKTKLKLRSPNLADAVMMLQKPVDPFVPIDDYQDYQQPGSWA